MRILISPAKKMREDTDTFLPEGLPAFLPQTEHLKAALEAMSPQELQRLWRCNDAIAALNVERLAHMDLRRHLTPALFSYEGIQYRYLAPGALEEAALDYLREHLRILSGFYGLLRPFDGVTPYRLEMQARLNVDSTGDLYGFWGSALAETLAAESDVVVNLASREYSRAVEPHLPSSVRFLTCTFGEEQEGKVLEKGTMCKMARGEMVRWMAQTCVTCPEALTGFDRLDYHFRPDLSSPQHFIFIKGGNEPCCKQA